MRRLLPLVVGLLSLATWPVAPVAAQTTRIEIRAGAVSIASQRRALFEGAVGVSSGAMYGIEVGARTGVFAVAARLIGGGFSADSGGEAVGRIHSGDVRALVGPLAFSGEIGYGRRAFSGALGSRSWAFARVGARSRLAIGASGLRAELGVAFYRGVGDPSSGGSGREAETRLTYVPSHLPIYLSVGYRHERFTVETPTETRPENVTGFLMAVGVRVHP